MNRKLVERNIKVYYLYSAFFVLIIGPILTLYLLDKGLNFTQIMTLQSVCAISVFVLEVPTGAIADLLGRKFSLIMSGLVFMIGLIIYIVFESFLFFAIAEVIVGLATCLKSGADSALLYDSLKVLDRKDEFVKIQGKAHSIFLFAQVIGSILASILYAINVDLPLIVSILLMFLSSIIALAFKEIEIHEHTKKPKYIEQIIDSANYLRHHKKVKAIVIYSMFFFVFYRIGFWYYQPLLLEINIDVIYFGVIFSLLNLIGALSARQSDTFLKLTKGKSLLALSILLCFSFIGIGLTRSIISIALILPQQMARGFHSPIFMKFMHKNIPSNKRATIISFRSLLQNLTVAICFPVVGYIMDHMNIIDLHIYTGIIMLIGIMIFYKYLNKKLSTNQS